MLDDAPPAREPKEGAKVSQGCELVADQLRVVNAVPVFVIAVLWEEVAMPRETSEKEREEVGTERTAAFATVTVIEVEVAVFE